jgi:7-cyano-7-deazaguanine synthase in queuosine biosynthesis/cytidylate kinase
MVLTNNISEKFVGVAIFGAPGSGKTTLAKALKKLFPNARAIESSQFVIFPAAKMKGNLPKAEGKFIQLISKAGPQKGIQGFSREDARKLFIHLKRTYSSSIIAKTLLFLHRTKFSKNFLIISGTRGFRNAMFLKKNGYLLVYLKTPDKKAILRLSKRENYSKSASEKEYKIEERLFSTNKVEKIAHLSFNTGATKQKELLDQINAIVKAKECLKCVNVSTNLSSTIGKNGLCDVCEKYEKGFSKNMLKEERSFLLSLKDQNRGKYNALVGISGGKDSTATLFQTLQLGFHPLSFSLDMGYYPPHIFTRSKAVAKELGVNYIHVNARKYIRGVDRESFEKTASLYDEHPSEELKQKFRRWYVEGRRHYSVKCIHSLPYVRTCQLCRKIIIRAYYAEALKHNVNVVILGINEWAGLSQDSSSKEFTFSAIRKLKPYKNKPAVYVVHLPFLLQRKINDTKKILRKLGWKVPRGESLVETNANSCLFARAAESKARKLLGFHPDSTRLAREVTVGFITKNQARKAIEKTHHYSYSVRKVLERAQII